jgi:hypothetical protein
MSRLRILRLVLVMGLMVPLLAVGQASADMSSTNYYVNEVQIGPGSSLHDCSTNYCAKTSVGDTVVGNGSSTNYSAQFGSNTSDEPMLEVSTENTDSDLGVLDVTTTATATATVKVRNYLSNGYTIQLMGTPLKMGTHTMEPMATQDVSTPGTEQFGINLVNNSSPDIGADPVQVPDSSFSYGAPYSGYDTPNQFMFNEGDIIAYSPTSSGETNYTISMIVNISNTTPGGAYKSSLSAVAVPIF